MPTSLPTLASACSAGRLDPEDWVQPLIDMVADPAASNQDLLLACSSASRGCSEEQATAWMDNLIEFSLWETGRIPGRLELCDHMAKEGLARVSCPKRWASYGSLLHVACEAGSLEAIAWAASREPSAAARPGGRLGIGAMQSLCMHEDEPTLLAGIGLLSRAGAKASHLSRDGRGALFRCASPDAAKLLIGLGADPWLPDEDGYCAVGLWLELGFWRCAKAAFASRPEALDEFIPWGSMGGRARKPNAPLRDRPLFIAACARALGERSGEPLRQEALRDLVSMGANPLLADARGARLHERSPSPAALSICEKAELEREGLLLEPSGRRGRL